MLHVSPRSTAPHTSVLQLDAHSILATYDNVLIGVLQGPNAYHTLDQSRRAHEQLRERYPQGFHKLIVSTTAAPLPAAAERQAIVGIAEEFGDCTLSAALVFEGGRLFVAATRSLTTVMLRLSGASFPQRTFGSTHDACVWFEHATSVPPRCDAHGLEAFLLGLRAQSLPN